MLKCGFFELDITPHIGSNIPGYGSLRKRKSEKIRDPLYAHAFAAQAGGQAIIIIALDLLSIEKEESDRIREGVSRVTGVPRDNVSVAVTHGHNCGPALGRVSFVHKEDDYCNFLVRRSIDAGNMAYQNLEEARIGVASCNVEGIAFSRRFRMKDGSYETNPGLLNPEIDYPVEPVDTELLVLRVDHADGTPMGMVVNYALHPDTMGGTAYSPDYPGEIRKHIRKAYGEEISFVYLQGACGNVNHLNVRKPREAQNTCQIIGKVLAEAILKEFPNIVTEDIDVVCCTNTVFTGHTRRPTMEEIERQQKLFRKKTMILACDLPDEEVPVEVWTGLIGENAIQMFPGELFASFGLEVKKNSGCKHTFISEQSNDAIGYIYTKEAEKQGGYEPLPNMYTKMNSDTGYQMVDTAIANIKRLKGNV